MALLKYYSGILFWICLGLLLMVSLAQEENLTAAPAGVIDDVTQPVGDVVGVTKPAKVTVGDDGGRAADKEIPTRSSAAVSPTQRAAKSETATPGKGATEAAEAVPQTPVVEVAQTTQQQPAVEETQEPVQQTTADAEPQQKVTEVAKITEVPEEVKVTEGSKVTEGEAKEEVTTKGPVAVEEIIEARTQNVLGGDGVKLFTDQQTEAAAMVTKNTQAVLPTRQVTAETEDEPAATTGQAEPGEIEATESVDVTTQATNTEQPQAPQQTTVKSDVVVSETVEPVTVESSLASLTTEATQAGLLVDLMKTTDQVQLDQTTSSESPDTTLKPDAQTTSVLDQQELTSKEQPATTIVIPTTQASDEKLLTTVVGEELTTEEQMAAEATETVVKSDDPCDIRNIKILDEKKRHWSQKQDGEESFCDTLEEQWYGFKYQGQWAEIPSKPIKKGYCSTEFPFRLDLSGDQSLPGINETVVLQLCVASEIGGELDKCVLGKGIRVKRCDEYYVYYLQPLAKTRKCMGAICTQLKGEDISAVDISIDKLDTNTAEITPTTEKPYTVKEVEDLTKDEQTGTVTVTFSNETSVIDRESFLLFERRFRELLVKYLNENPVEKEELTQTQAMTEHVPDAEPAVTVTVAQEVGLTGGMEPTADSVSEVSDDSQNSVIGENKQGTEAQDLSQTNGGLRRRRDAGVTEEPRYTADSVIFVGPTPRINKDGKLELALIVKDKDGNVVPAEVLKKALENMDNPSDDPAIKQEKVTVGLPVDILLSPAKQEKKDVWEAHMGLWITIIVLCAVCIITLIVCCVCFRCCDREDGNPEKSPLQMEEGKKSPSVVIENPLPDEVITRDEAPMVEHENPAFTSNGGGQHLTKDEDNGWIVPLEQLTDADKQKADVENTKL